MIRLNDNLWIGDSTDEEVANLGDAKIGVVLNVAQDLTPTRGWKSGVEYMQVGLVDGPGNELSVYYSAVLALNSLLKRKRVLVCCHTGGRSLVVAVMYIHALSERGWDGCLEILRERVDGELPVSHVAHRDAFDRIDWKALKMLM